MSWVLPFILFILLQALLSLTKWHKRQFPLPPGPFCLPILGHMLLASKMTHRGLSELSSFYSRGTGLLYLRLGCRHILTVSTPAMAKQLFKTYGQALCNRPNSTAIAYLTYGNSDLSFANYGPFWRQARKILVQNFFSRVDAESWAAVRRKALAIIPAIAVQSGGAVDLGRMVFDMSRNLTFSYAFSSQSRENDEKLTSVIFEISRLILSFNIGDFFPWLKLVNLSGVNERMKRARHELDYFTEKIIDEHRKKPKGTADANRDIIDVLLDFYIDSEEEGGNADSSADANSLKSFKISKNNIKAVITDILLGGLETVASSIEWAMAELMRSPDERQKVQNELAMVVGLDRRVQETDLDKLPYLKCVIKEVLRLHPAGTVTQYETATDIILDKYFVPAGTHVMINIWDLCRNKSAWTDPDVFRPSRFAVGEGEAANIDFRGGFFEFIPFGSGRRSCPGMQIGLYILQLTLAELLHCFDWELPMGMMPSELNMEDIFGMSTVRAVRLVAVPTSRLSCSLEA